jgi:folate-binding Fe-S cluster repair protein YgfZ
MAATTLTDRAVVRLSGEDVRGFLQGLVTSDVAGAAAGLGRAADAAGQMPVRFHRLGATARTCCSTARPRRPTT